MRVCTHLKQAHSPQAQRPSPDPGKPSDHRRKVSDQWDILPHIGAGTDSSTSRETASEAPVPHHLP